MFAAGMLGAIFGAGGTLAYFEATGASNLTGGRLGGAKRREAAQPSKAVTPVAEVSKSWPASKGDVSMALYDELAARVGLPSSDTVFVKQGYVSSFDAQRRIPRWVMERVTPATIATKEARRDSSKFYANTDVPEPFRATNADYASSGGLSRGHLAPAQFHKDSQAAMDATFDLSLNAVPQDMASNATDWLRVEQLVKRLAKDTFTTTYIVTGPLFMPKEVPPKAPKGKRVAKPETTNADNNKPRRVVEYELVGKHDVAVPTHLFKAVLGERADGSRAFASFVVPNEPIAEERPLTSFLVPKETLEKWTGLQFFPKAMPPSTNNVPSICATAKCEASAGGLGVSYRNIAKLRAAPTPQVLDREWQGMCAARGGCDKVDASIVKEYAEQRKAFGLQA